MKALRPARNSLQDYRNRDYVLSHLDDKVFDILNKGVDGSFLMTTGCLDALDVLPAGSMVSANNFYYDSSVINRGISAAEEKEINDFMMGLVDKLKSST